MLKFSSSEMSKARFFPRKQVRGFIKQIYSATLTLQILTVVGTEPSCGKRGDFIYVTYCIKIRGRYSH